MEMNYAAKDTLKHWQKQQNLGSCQPCTEAIAHDLVGPAFLSAELSSEQTQKEHYKYGIMQIAVKSPKSVTSSRVMLPYTSLWSRLLVAPRD